MSNETQHAKAGRRCRATQRYGAKGTDLQAKHNSTVCYKRKKNCTRYYWKYLSTAFPLTATLPASYLYFGRDSRFSCSVFEKMFP